MRTITLAASTFKILRFPFRAVTIVRESAADGWLVIAGDNGWLHGDFGGALQDAKVIAAGYGLVVLSSAGRFLP